MKTPLTVAASRLCDLIYEYNNIDKSSRIQLILGASKSDVKDASDELRVKLATQDPTTANSLFNSVALRLCDLVDEHDQVDETSAIQMFLGVCKGDLENAAAHLRAVIVVKEMDHPTVSSHQS